MLHIISVAYKKPIFLRIHIDSFICQSNQDFQLTIIHDGPASKEVKDVVALYKNKEPQILFIETETRVGNWGNENRQVALQLLNGKKGDFVLMTNADNYYVPSFIEQVMTEVKRNTGFLYFDFLHHPFHYQLMRSKPEVNWIDLGAYITELKLAQEIGFNRITRSEADGLFAMEAVAYCKRRGLEVIKINRPLLVHN
ncbi:MAG: glycosyltransferase family A protein [Candidatus Omnitrophica bacterium]|nr:glycosyltransferase family A protein [Candidatus Omnitrophota bacterium]